MLLFTASTFEISSYFSMTHLFSNFINLAKLELVTIKIVLLVNFAKINDQLVLN